MSIEEQKEYVEKKWMNIKIDRKLYKKRINSFVKKIIKAINNNTKEDSKEVQDLMQNYFEILNIYHPISKKEWLRIAISLSQDLDAYTMWAKVHPKMPEFLFNAMKIYGDNLIK